MRFIDIERCRMEIEAFHAYGCPLHLVRCETLCIAKRERSTVLRHVLYFMDADGNQYSGLVLHTLREPKDGETERERTSERFDPPRWLGLQHEYEETRG